MKSRSEHKGWYSRGYLPHLDAEKAVQSVSFRLFDRYIRNNEHFKTVIAYILNNPVKAGLAESPQEWPWSYCLLFEVEKDV